METFWERRERFGCVTGAGWLCPPPRPPLSLKHTRTNLRSHILTVLSRPVVAKKLADSDVATLVTWLFTDGMRLFSSQSDEPDVACESHTRMSPRPEYES